MDAFDALLRSDFLTFVAKCFLHLHGEPMLPNWHIEAVAHAFERIFDGRNKRLIINLPPRHMKSLIASIAYPAFVLGHDPSKRIIAVSYSSDLAVKFSNDFRSIIESDWYRRIFPGTVAGRKYSETEVSTSKGGFRLATSIGGTLTGRGADLIIVDDPMKPNDAASEKRREAVEHWFFGTLLTRLDDKAGGAVVLAMQRIHVEDLTAKMRERTPRKLFHLLIPALIPDDGEFEEYVLGYDDDYYRREAGTVIQPERESRETIEHIRKELGTYDFEAQYQQNPQTRDGNWIKKNWLRRYDTPPPRTPSSQIVQSWDTASKGGPNNDYSVCITFQIEEGRFYILDILRGKFDYPTLVRVALDHGKVHRPQRMLIEETGIGLALIAELRNKFVFAVEAIVPVRSKEERLAAESSKIEAGAVYLPNAAPWLDDFERELLLFPRAPHDDQVDALSQGLAHGEPTYDPTMGWLAIVRKRNARRLDRD